MTAPPSRVRWTAHALEKAGRLGVSRRDLELALLENHSRRSRNPGAAAWRLRLGALVVVYDHPDRRDVGRACIVTLWKRR